MDAMAKHQIRYALPTVMQIGKSSAIQFCAFSDCGLIGILKERLFSSKIPQEKGKTANKARKSHLRPKILVNAQCKLYWYQFTLFFKGMFHKNQMNTNVVHLFY